MEWQWLIIGMGALWAVVLGGIPWCEPSRIQVLLSTALPTGARSGFSHCQSLPSGSLQKPLNLIHQRADSRSKNNYNLAAHGMKTAVTENYAMSNGRRMKEQDKTPEKQLNKVEIRNILER